MGGSVRRHPLAKCEECPLATVGKYVPSQFPNSGKAEIAFVGEAPGLQEARSGVPFTGPSGELLNTVMRHHGIRRKEVLLTNACLCRPPDNATPPSMAIKACGDRLQYELELTEVKTAVALGNSAAQALTGRTGVTKLRVGSGIPSSFDPNLRVVSTLHPAYCLRNADGFPSLVVDVGKAVNPGVQFTPPEYRVVRSSVSAIRLCRELLRGEGPLVVDIETNVEKDRGFDHPNQHGMLCIGIGRRSEGYHVLAEGSLTPRVYKALRTLLLRRGVIAQNGKFDLAGLYKHIGSVPLKFDTMLASYVFDERPGIHGLKHMAQEYLGAPPYDDEIKRYLGKGDGYGVIPRDILYRYNAYDIYCTDLLYEMFSKRLSNNPDAARLHEFLVAASGELMFLELNGIAVDLGYLKQLEQQFFASLGEQESRMDMMLKNNPKVPVDFINPRSPQQVKKVLHSLGMRVASTDKETLYKIQDHCKALATNKNLPGPEAFPIYNFVTALLEHRREAKLYGTYVKGIRQRLYRGRVYPTFLVHGTTTGRLSSRNPNMQNIPRGSTIRNQFVPAKSGYVFVQSDYAQAELRVLTWLASCTYFRDIFNAGDIDLFDQLTPVLYPRLPPKSLVHPGEWKEVRIRIKAFVYGLGYGRGEGSIAEEFKIPYGEALTLKRNFFSVIPEIVQWQKEIQQLVLQGEDLKTPFGRSRRFGLITTQNRHEVLKEALAFKPQSISSDICLGAMGNVRRELRGVGWVRNIVHDSILVECAPERADFVSRLMDARMVESAAAVVGDYVKFATDSKVGLRWGEV
jgi:uracil-DNA glycosylase family 4